MSGDEIKISSKGNKPNKEADILIAKVKEFLKEDLLEFSGGSFDKNERLTIESLNRQYKDKAEVFINPSGKGAVVLSSSGSVTEIGEQVMDVTHYFNKAAEKEDSYMWREILTKLKSGGVVDATERERLEELDEIFTNVSIVIADDGKSVAMVDANGTSGILTPPTETKSKGRGF